MFFLFSFLVLTLVYWKQMVLSKKIITFQGSGGGQTISGGGGGGGGIQLLILYRNIETHITCDFPGGGGLDPLPPSSPHLPDALLHEAEDRVQLCIRSSTVLRGNSLTILQTGMK